MNIKNLRDILLMQKRELERYLQKNYTNRDIQLTDLNSDIIKVIIGPRRAGKSFFAIHELSAAFPRIGYVNFDDEGLLDVENYNDIIETLKVLYDNPEVLFLDEIQNLPRWELLVNRLQRQGFNLVLTGSNSNLLSSELSTHLTGRHLSTLVFPFSFKEYLRYFGQECTTSEKKQHFQNYLYNGGFPEPLVKDLDYREYLKSLHDSIIFKDIIRRHKIKSAAPLGDLSQYLMSNTAGFLSYRNLTKLTGYKSTHTIRKYLEYFEESFLFFQLRGYSHKLRQQMRGNKKIYTIDNGYIASKAFQFSRNIGTLYENTVAIELKRRELKGEFEFFYYKNPQGYEVDFIIKEGLKITRLIQVSYDVSNEKTREREVRALLHAGKDLHCDNFTVITGDYLDVQEVNWYGQKGTIHFVPLHDFLTNEMLTRME